MINDAITLAADLASVWWPVLMVPVIAGAGNLIKTFTK